MTPRLTAPQREALERLQRGQSLRGHTHGVTINHLKIKRLIEDSDTITDAGRAAIADPYGEATPEIEPATIPDTRDRKVEGWTWMHGARKWHYFRGHRAICGGAMLFAHPGEGYQLGNDSSVDNCAACKRARLSEIAKANGIKT